MSATPDSRLADPQQIIADLQRQLTDCRAERDEALAERDKAQRRLAERTAERDEALEQQTATAEVLRVINSSPGDLAPVFGAMLDKALSLCEASFGGLRRFDGKMFWAIAVRDASGAAAEIAHQPVVPDPGSASERIVQGETVVHIPDLADTEEYRSGVVSRLITVEKLGARTALWVALRKDDVLVGDFVIYRKEVRSFTEQQIALLQNFAAQAVIAMENARLITETREALEQQTATAEVLQVINSSPGDLAPVFDAMLEKAMRLCGAAFGQLGIYDKVRFRTAAQRGVPAAYVEFRKRNAPNYGPGTVPARIQAGERIVHVLDLREEDAYRAGEPNRRALVDLGGARSLLAVALAKGDAVLGFLNVYRQEVNPYTDKQITLLQNFAAQAVIAMENARLLAETRAALEQQTATAEVLQVINSSPGDLAPVFQAMLQKAHTLCEASFGALMTYDGERFYPVAHQGTPAPFREFLASGIRPGRGDPFERIVEGTAFSHIHDLSEVAARYPDEPLPSAAVDLGGIRTLLVVPLRKDSALLGVITAYRQEVRPFTEKQIALLQNFAAQAVILLHPFIGPIPDHDLTRRGPLL